MRTHYQVLIIGGGQAGISVAAQLLRKRSSLDIAIVEPSGKHLYQPGLTLVGGGVFTLDQIIRDESVYAQVPYETYNKLRGCVFVGWVKRSEPIKTLLWTKRSQ